MCIPIGPRHCWLLLHCALLQYPSQRHAMPSSYIFLRALWRAVSPSKGILAVLDDPTENGAGAGLVKNKLVGVVAVMQNCKQRATQTRAKTEIMATAGSTAAMRATTTRGTRMGGARMKGRRCTWVPLWQWKSKLWILCEQTRIHYWYHVVFTSRQVHFYFYSNKFGADLCSFSSRAYSSIIEWRLFEKGARCNSKVKIP